MYSKPLGTQHIDLIAGLGNGIAACLKPLFSPFWLQWAHNCNSHSNPTRDLEWKLLFKSQYCTLTPCYEMSRAKTSQQPFPETVLLEMWLHIVHMKHFVWTATQKTSGCN